MTLEEVRPSGLAALEEAAGRARDYVGQARAQNTLRGYRSDWTHFEAWCRDHELPSLPAAPESVALYLAALAETHKASTLQRRLSSISQAHKAAGLESPTGHAGVRAVWAGIRRAKGVAQEGKAPAVTEEVRAMVSALPDSLLGTRDRALLLLGFAGAFRRSELVSLDVGDVQETREGLVATLKRSKTDQEGEGRHPVRLQPLHLPSTLAALLAGGLGDRVRAALSGGGPARAAPAGQALGQGGGAGGEATGPRSGA